MIIFFKTRQNTVIAVESVENHNDNDIKKFNWLFGDATKIEENVVEQAIEQLVQMHDLDFERFWVNFNKMDRNTLMLLAQNKNPLTQRELPTSTSFSSLKRLTKNGYVIKTETYEIEDPFFQRWIQQNILSSK